MEILQDFEKNLQDFEEILQDFEEIGTDRAYMGKIGHALIFCNGAAQ